MPLDIQIASTAEQVYSVKLTGSIEEETYVSLQKKLDSLIQGNIKQIVLDMKGVDYISSAGIGVLVASKTATEKKGASFAIINMQSNVKKVIEVMRLSQILNVS